MGLDQYAYTRETAESEPIELAQWRKHNRLQGWMEEKFHQQDTKYLFDGSGEEFNCVELELKSSDLKESEDVILNKSLPMTGGFFFGNDSYEDYEQYHKKIDMKFLVDARKAFQQGKKVYYNCWW